MEFIKANEEDFESLVELRIKVMKPSLEKIGRFNPKRARDRFFNSFIPEQTTIVKNEGKLLGFYMFSEDDKELFLNHLYIDSIYQGQGIGKKIIHRVKNYSSSVSKNIRLEALKESPANDFYIKNGFNKIYTSEFDNIYLWKPNNSVKNIYITDLDSTLLNEKAELSEYAKEGIKSLLKNNVLFTVASARSVKSIKPIFKDIDLKLPIIETNGAYITDLKTEKHLLINSINTDLYKEILEELVIKGYNCIISTFNGQEDKLYYDKTINDGDKYYINQKIDVNDSRLEKIDNIRNMTDEDFISILVIDKYKKLKPELDRLSKIKEIDVHLQENIYSPGWFWLTITDCRATKGRAIKEFLKLQNEENYNVMCFGDNTNDIEMLKVSNKAIAVENAIDELKEIADEIIDSNINNGVLKYIKENEGHI